MSSVKGESGVLLRQPHDTPDGSISVGAKSVVPCRHIHLRWTSRGTCR